jgi:hypothetical protein
MREITGPSRCPRPGREVTREQVGSIQSGNQRVRSRFNHFTSPPGGIEIFGAFRLRDRSPPKKHAMAKLHRGNRVLT